MEQKLSKVQFAIFFKNPINRPDLLASAVSSEFDIFNAPPFNIPLPPEAPVEIPSSQLKSTDGKWQLNISKIRVDLFFNVKEEKDEEDYKNLEERKIMKKIILLCLRQAREQHTEINRVANIVHYFIIPENPIEFLQEKLIKKEFSNTAELTIRFNQQEKLNEFEINNITIIESAKKTDGDEQTDIVLVQKDLNTRADKPKDFSDEEIKKFFDSSEEILSWGWIKNIFL